MTGDPTRTAPAFQALIKTYPAEPGVHALYASYLLSSRPAEEAMIELRRELEVNPKSADARAMIALLMVRAGLKSAALPYAKQAAADGPTSPMAQYTYGLILTSTGDLPEAIARLETARSSTRRASNITSAWLAHFQSRPRCGRAPRTPEVDRHRAESDSSAPR